MMAERRAYKRNCWQRTVTGWARIRADSSILCGCGVVATERSGWVTKSSKNEEERLLEEAAANPSNDGDSTK